MYIEYYIAVAFLFTSFANAWFSNICGNVQRADVDPIVNIGTKSAHTHDIIGSTVLTSTSTHENLLKSPCSTCTRKGDRSAYWFPTIYQKLKNGSEVALRPDFIPVYYEYPSDGSEPINPVPNGMKMIVGKAQPASVEENGEIFSTLFYAQEGFKEEHSQGKGFNEKVEKEVKTFVIVIFTPPCMKGPDVLDSSDHISHVAKLGPDGKCPPGFPYRVPQVNFHPVFDLPEPAKWSSRADMPFRLSVDNEYGNMHKFHLDLFFAWDQAILKDMIRDCKEKGCEGEFDKKFGQEDQFIKCFFDVRKQADATPLDKLIQNAEAKSPAAGGHKH